MAHELPWYTDQVAGPVRVMRTAHGAPGVQVTPAAGATASIPVGWATIVSRPSWAVRSTVMRVPAGAWPGPVPP